MILLLFSLEWFYILYIIHLMYGPEGKQLVLFSRESWCFPRRSRGKHQDSRENITNWFPKGPYITCFVIYLDFPLNNHIAKTNKQSAVRATTAQLYPGRDAFEFDQGARDQESTNHRAHFVE